MTRRPLWIQTVVARTCIFFFSLFFFSFLLFLLGNLQEFLDTTQIMLLQIAGVSSFLYVVTSLYFLGIAAVMIARRRRVGWHRVVLVLAGLVVAVGVSLVTNFLQSWIEQVM